MLSLVLGVMLIIMSILMFLKGIVWLGVWGLILGLLEIRNWSKGR